ncbi:hypothetical protein A6J80_14005 [Paracoccus yeei]|uniref:Uncharacterized protein n=1 Tax=Paracoccus yeei TaxID=147645 RepID=A0A1V0GTZ2_9RHOB|nr:hypothetical protein [Paracoccus yeei]ARC37335.1 hypothetical protein A6J80_14005 [Paracoccus yeei]
MVNNRGLENDSWFYMARGHAFAIQAMKDRMVEIAASRIDRGKLTYGPSRAELERALREGRAVREKPLEGRAIREAMIQIAANIATLRLFSSLTRQGSDAELAAKIAEAEAVLSRGGIIPLQEQPMDAKPFARVVISPPITTAGWTTLSAASPASPRPNVPNCGANSTRLRPTSRASSAMIAARR